MTLSQLVLLGVWILLPLIPAILIYFLIPDALLVATGALAGLHVNAGGASAGYFILVAMMYPLVSDMAQNIDRSSQRYLTVKGTVKLVDPQKRRIVYFDDRLKELGFESNPRVFHKTSNRIALNVPEDIRGGYPIIVFKIPKWGNEVVDLNDHKWRKRIHELKRKRARESLSQLSAIERILQGIRSELFGEIDGVFDHGVVDVGEVEIARTLPAKIHSRGSSVDRPTR